MTPDEQRNSDRQVCSNLMAEMREHYPTPNAAKARWVDAIAGVPDLLQAALAEAAERFFGELERKRIKGLRACRVYRNGEQLSIPFLDQTFPEAWISVGREEDNAVGAAERAAYDRFAVELAETICRERGLDPQEIEMTIGDFVTSDDVASAWHERSAA